MSRFPSLLALAYASTVCLATGVTGCDPAAPEDSSAQALTGSNFQRVFVIMMENQNSTDIYGSSKAPYLNQLMGKYAYSANFQDVLPASLPSEPHYVWLEAGTNAFSDHTFSTDSDPSSSNSTGSSAHLVNLLTEKGLSWTAYQEGISSTTGACPVKSSSSTFYAAKHNPFVFFRDISGNPPGKTTAGCSSHMKPITQLASDLSAGTVAHYNLITPNLCHDMHGAIGCPLTTIQSGDDWLKANLPAILSYASANQGVVFITWDETEGETTQPFVVVGPHVKAGYKGTVLYNMSSVLKSMQEIFQVTPLLGHAADPSTNDLSDLFVAGAFP
jgi:hypothetical protein